MQFSNLLLSGMFYKTTKLQERGKNNKITVCAIFRHVTILTACSDYFVCFFT